MIIVKKQMVVIKKLIIFLILNQWYIQFIFFLNGPTIEQHWLWYKSVVENNSSMKNNNKDK